jgi:hypothetical protein
MWFNLPYSFTSEHVGTVIYIVPGSLLLALFAFSVVVLLRNRGSLAPPLPVFGVLIVLGILLQAPLSAYERMLIPLVPAILLLGAVACERVRSASDR